VQYKPYPVCRFHHSQLDVATALLLQTPTAPDDIESIVSAGMPFAAKADPYEVENPFDAQFSLPYAMALVAHGIPPGLVWQAPETMADPRIRRFMRRVIPEVLPDARERKRADPRTWPCQVEIRTKTGTLRGAASHASGDPVDGFRLTDQELRAKFLSSARDTGFDQKTATRLAETLDALPELTTVRDLLAG
jgi:2-methylcitrate dehydratase PrpD